MLRVMKIPTCHPEREHRARGLCSSCYQTWYEKNRGLVHSAPQPSCHPERRHEAKGLCRDCYTKQNRKARPWRKYELTPAQYRQMVASQGERCAICGDTSKLVIDHDHGTLAVRSLLCKNCNTGLGMFKDNPSILEAATSYLRSHRLSEVS